MRGSSGVVGGASFGDGINRRIGAFVGASLLATFIDRYCIDVRRLMRSSDIDIIAINKGSK